MKECWRYDCRNKVIAAHSILCPEHMAEATAARDYKYVSYCKACIEGKGSTRMHNCTKYRSRSI